MPGARNAANKAVTGGSLLFIPFRGVGFVTGDAPFYLSKRGSEHFVLVSVGKAWHLYNGKCISENSLFRGFGQCDKLRLASASRPCPHNLAVVACSANGAMTFAATHDAIRVYQRMDPIMVLECRGRVLQLLPFGQSLVSIDSTGELAVWNISLLRRQERIDSATCLEPDKRIQLDISCEDEVTCLMHPATYLNKVVIGYHSGRMELWNLSTCKCIFSFASFNAPIKCCRQSPAIDVVGVGLGDGRVILHNLRSNKVIATFSHDGGIPVNDISFRTDGTSHMAAATMNGRITIWDLDKQSLSSVIQSAHRGQVISASYFAGEPLLLSSGTDNALRMWIFDEVDGSARVLRERSGHASPPDRVRFHGASSDVLITSSSIEQAIRVTSITRDERNREFAQGKKQLSKYGRLPGISDFDTVTARERDWDSMLSCHQNSNQVVTWSLERTAIGKHKFTCPPINEDTSDIATAVCASPCGHFGIVGTNSGRMYKFNLQSGISRGAFKSLDNVPEAHPSSIVGIFADLVNAACVSASLDGTLKRWDMKKQREVGTTHIGCRIGKIVLHPDNHLLAVACDDLIVRLFDSASFKCVRRFPSSKSRITDMCFSACGHWLVSASMDGSVRVFDIPSSKIIDWIRFSKPVTSIAFSPSSEFLVTTHAGNLGVFLWANRTYFGNVYVCSAPSEPYDLKVGGIDVEKHVSAALNLVDTFDGAIVDQSVEMYESIDKISSHGTELLLGLSSLPRSRWQTLANLATIKERNKPIEAPEMNADAPFFIPTVPGLEPKFDVISESAGNGHSSHKPIVSTGSCTLAQMLELESEDETKSFSRTLSYLLSLSPAAIDGELRSLGLNPDEEEREFILALRFFAWALEQRQNFEAIEAYLHVFLDEHATTLLSYATAVKSDIQLLLARQESNWKILEKYLNTCVSMVTHVAGLQI